MTGSPVSAPSGPSEYEQMFCESWLQMRSRGGEDSWSNWKLRGQTPPQSTLRILVSVPSAATANCAIEPSVRLAA